MKKLLTITAATLLMAPAAFAKPVHLECKDKVATKDGEPKELATHQVFIDTTTNVGKYHGEDYSLEVKPTTLRLVKTTEEQKATYSMLTISSLLIQRKDLTFIKNLSGIISGEKFEFKSSGTCRIVKTPAGNKI